MAKDYVMDILNEAFVKGISESKNNAEEYIKDFDFKNYFRKATDTISDKAVEYFEQTMYEKVLEERSQTDEFLAIQEQKWGKCFIVFEAMYIMTIESAEQYCKYVSEIDKDFRDSKKFLFLSLREIHGRACQEFLEILCLMKNGFADGAYARWRSMYELSIIAEFISKNGEKIAKAFFDASNTNDRYDWAKDAVCFKNLNKKHITFSDIQRQCDFATDDWNRQYDLANKTVHASPQGTFGRLARKEYTNVVLVGRTDYGITTPAEHSSISIAVISKIFFSIFPNGDSIVAIKNLNNWIDIVRKYFFTTHDELFEENKFEDTFKQIIDN